MSASPSRGYHLGGGGGGYYGYGGYVGGSSSSHLGVVESRGGYRPATPNRKWVMSFFFPFFSFSFIFSDPLFVCLNG